MTMEGVIDLRLFHRLEYMGRRSVINWCMAAGLIASGYECPKCKNTMNLAERLDLNDGFEWRCARRSCGVKRSVRKGSFFSLSKLSIIDILLITGYWVCRMPAESIMEQVRVSNKSVTDWMSFCREVCMDACVRESEKLGGENVIVEIDESQFGKRKFNKGKSAEEKWVFRGLEKGSDKCFFRVVDDRTSATLLGIIREYILPGTTIVSGCWKSYNCLEEEGFITFGANHRICFKDPEKAGDRTNSENSWSAIKIQLPRHRCENDFTNYLCEYIWRRKKAHKGDSIKRFLEDVRVSYVPSERDDDDEQLIFDDSIFVSDCIILPSKLEDSSSN